MSATGHRWFHSSGVDAGQMQAQETSMDVASRIESRILAVESITVLSDVGPPSDWRGVCRIQRWGFAKEASIYASGCSERCQAEIKSSSGSTQPPSLARQNQTAELQCTQTNDLQPSVILCVPILSAHASVVAKPRPSRKSPPDPCGLSTDTGRPPASQSQSHAPTPPDPAAFLSLSA